MDKDGLLTVEETAKLLFVSQSHVHKLLQRGDLTAIQDTPESAVHVLRTAVLEYRKKMRAAQKAGLDAIVEASDRLGLYEMELEDLPHRRKD